MIFCKCPEGPKDPLKRVQLNILVRLKVKGEVDQLSHQDYIRTCAHCNKVLKGFYGDYEGLKNR